MPRHTPRLPLNSFSGSLLSAALAAGATCLLGGCGTQAVSPAQTTSATHATSGATGVVFGGQQPVSGAQVYMYAAGTAGPGSSGRSMLAAPGHVTTTAKGNFTLTGYYTCQPSEQVYLVALGGDAGSGTNTAIGLMAALGPCSALTVNTFVNVNELSTVAGVAALSNYIVSPTGLGDTGYSNNIAAAFANTGNLVVSTTGIAPATTPVGNGIVPQANIDSLGDSLAYCINSTTSSNTCATLFSYAVAGTSTPANTLQAAINILHNPTQHAADIYNLPSGVQPFQPTLSGPPNTWAIAPSFPSDVLTFHNDVARSGVQSAETRLTPALVTSANFGKLRTFTVDGYMYAQPLYVGGYGMPDGSVHDLVLAATAHGTVYAFDADGNNPAAGYLWKQSMFAAGEGAVLQSDYGNCSDTVPESSLLGTPVIDRSTGTLYVVSTEKITATGAFTQKLHALNLVDGTEKFNGPTLIAATYAGTGGGSVGGVLTFDALKQNQRPALLLSNGTVWITWASHCDIQHYHGYVMGYNAADVSTRTVLFNNTPGGEDGGIWMSQGGPAADAQGAVYIVGGNGTFDADTGGSDFGDTGMKFTAPASGSTKPTIADYFTPSNQASLSSSDQDVGVSEALLFSDPSASATYAPNLMLESDKTGRIYLLNTAHMGGYAGSSSPNPDLQDFTLGGNIFNNPTFFNGTLYMGTDGVPLRAFAFVSGTSTAAGHFNTTYTSQAGTTPGGSYGSGGVTPAVSANGTSNAIVWTVEHSGSPAKLHAYDATNLGTEFYNSGQAASSRDQVPTPVKFNAPVIANGYVFLGGQSSIAVYGLLH
jgi:hypothetical protein